ncbi:MAG TPA: hypothetical protein VN851_28170, partial [Thermoanaerobaculia bacterium]|nr:hypothetical protein [Thermoanaerobaculia bacterium]
PNTSSQLDTIRDLLRITQIRNTTSRSGFMHHESYSRSIPSFFCIIPICSRITRIWLSITGTGHSGTESPLAAMQNRIVAMHISIVAFENWIEASQNQLAVIGSLFSVMQNRLPVMPNQLAVMRSWIAVMQTWIAVMQRQVAVMRRQVAVMRISLVMMQRPTAACQSSIVVMFDPLRTHETSYAAVHNRSCASRRSLRAIQTFPGMAQAKVATRHLGR